VLTPQGDLDRKALAARVFSDAQERAALNAILHPLIGREVRARLDRLAARGSRLPSTKRRSSSRTGCTTAWTG